MLNKITENLKKSKLALASAACTAACVVPAFAETPASFVVTADMISPIATSVTTSVTNMLPVCLGIMGIMVGVSLIPRFIWKFL